MTQSIVVQVGQCGNQIGCRFWDLALREHAQYNKSGLYDEALSSFFRNTEYRNSVVREVPIGTGRNKIRSLKARAVLVDMEEGVVSELLNGPLREVFDNRMLLTDVSGSGNNWAVGNKMYGVRYHDSILETLRKSAELCDCLQSFFILHSMGGGTGSGVGTRILEILKDEFPEVYRFVVAVFPSADDDVITSPYNSVLALNELTENGDCVLPIDNQSLIDICTKVARASRGTTRGGARRDSTVVTGEGGVAGSNEKPFDAMNNIVANLLLNFTSPSRFEGSLNVDLNEISMNLVPFPRLHYLVSAMSPLFTYQDVGLPTHMLNQSFSDVFSRDYQLIKADPKHNLYLACALMLRGKVNMSDIRRNIERLQPSLKFVHWNQQGWKTGHCSIPPIKQPYSVLSLANNTCFRHTLSDIRERFNRLFRRKAHMHHYTHVDGMEISQFTDSLESLNSLVCEYETLETTMGIPAVPKPRLRIA